MARRFIDANVGLRRLGGSPVYASEPHFIASVQQQTKQLTDALLRIFKGFEDASPEIMMDALRPTFWKSQIYCPHLTGELRDSGYLEVTLFRGNPRVEMGYARGGNPRYAVVVHEMVEQYHRPPTRAKWLQVAVQEDLGELLPRLANGYRPLING